ncbi:hypothetical protein HYT57_00180 [Candidatus Woesearchaeota archaeon]|nr:hypothetical protein [Candidatus Woesearchaeota archaeon]
MTFLYRLLGIPGDLEETIDKSDTRGIIPEVVLRRKRENSLNPNSVEYKYKLRILVGRTGFTISEWTRYFNNYIPGIDKKPALLKIEDKHAMGRAYEIAEELATKGGTNRIVRINGKFYNLFRV